MNTSPNRSGGDSTAATPRAAEEVFLDYLERVRGGASADFEGLCRAHPRQSEELRALHANHARLNAHFFGRPHTSGPASRIQTLRAGEVLGDHELLGILGQGGMGQVWEARHLSMERRVALKVVHPDRVSDSALEFFSREARAGGRLNHPGIVRLYGHGSTSGMAWISMELVEGACTLRDSLDEMRETEFDASHYGRVAEFIAQTADALQAAHDAGVIHRDIKPHNILITPEDRPKVADFGLARITDETAISTTGEFIGTYAYMSPEQALARRIGIDHRTDVFSLGVVMYEMLAQRRPFEGDTVAQLTEQVVTHDPPLVTELRSRVPMDLALICQKALEKNRARRYASMAAFAADLRRHLNRTPILARPVSRIRKLQLWSMRHQKASLAAALTIVAMAVISVLTLRVHRTSKSLLAKTIEAAASAQEAHRNLDRALVVDKFLRDLLAAPSPWAEGYDVTVASILDRASAELETGFQGTPEARASLQAVLGASYEALAMPEKAVHLQEEALAVLTRLLGPEDPETLAVMAAMAETLISLDRVDEAVLLAERAAGSAHAVLGSAHPTTVEASCQIANAHLIAGRLAEGEKVLRTVLRAFTGQEETRGLLRLQVLGSLAVNLDGQARFDESSALYEELVRRRTELLGADDPWTTSAMESLANHYMQRGRLEEAEPLFERVYTSRVTLFGEQHPNALMAAENIGRVMDAGGRWPEAEEYFRRVLAGRLETLGPRHRWSLRSMINLSWVLYKQDKVAESEAMQREALALCREEDVVSSDTGAALLTNLAQLLRRKGEHEEALALTQEAIEVRTRLHGASHPDTLSTRSDLAEDLERRGELEEAEALRRTILDGYQQTFGDDNHPLTLIAKNNLGWLLRTRGELGEAEALLSEALTGRIEAFGKAHPSTLDVMTNLALVCREAGAFERSEELYRELVSIHKQRLGEAHGSTLWYMEEHGAVLMGMDRIDEAETLLGSAVDLATQRFGSGHIYTARAQHLFGVALVESKKYEQAELQLRAAAATRRAAVARLGRPVVIETLGKLGQCLSRMGQFEEAEALLLETHAGMSADPSVDPARVQWCVGQLKDLYTRSGQDAEAARWRDRR